MGFCNADMRRISEVKIIAGLLGNIMGSDVNTILSGMDKVDRSEAPESKRLW